MRKYKNARHPPSIFHTHVSDDNAGSGFERIRSAASRGPARAVCARDS